LDLALYFERTNNGVAGIRNNNLSVIQKFREGSGLRFKVLGDGKQWNFIFKNATDGYENGHSVTISTRKDRVVEISIPYNRVPLDVKNRRFDKTKVDTIEIERFWEDRSTSTLKIFDFEILP